MKKTNILITILLFTSVVLEIINIHFSNKLATESLEVSALEKEILQLEQKNNTLESNILKFTSYDVISSKAASLGFVEPKIYLYLDKPLEVAVKR